MTLRQQHLWIGIVATAGVWGLYAWVLGSEVAGGGLSDPGFARQMGGLFLLGLLMVGIVEGVLGVIVRLLSRGPQREGAAERRAALEASHLSLMALIALVTAASASLFLVGLIGQPALGPILRAATPANLLVLIANGLMGCVVLSELARFGLTLALMRRRG